jgi:methionine aminopeptidase
MRESVGKALNGKSELLPLWFTTMLQYSLVSTVGNQYEDFGEIGAAIQKFIKSKGRYSIVKDYCGHGIGVDFHEEPQIVHYKNNDKTKVEVK